MSWKIILTLLGLLLFFLWYLAREASAQEFAEEVASHLTKFFVSCAGLAPDAVHEGLQSGHWPDSLIGKVKAIDLVFEAATGDLSPVSLEVTTQEGSRWSAKWTWARAGLPESVRERFILGETRVTISLDWPVSFKQLQRL